MKRYPVLILAYRRTTELQLVLDSLAQLNPSIIYFHLHDAPNEEHQKEVNEVKKLISLYKGAKEVKYSKEPLGNTSSFYTALEWISSKEEQFYIFEDDILLHENVSSKLDSLMTRLSIEDGVVKFGDRRNEPVYWGWATTSKTAKRLLTTKITDFSYDEIGSFFTNKIHYQGTMKLYERRRASAWDDECGILTKVLGINEILSKTTLTDHIGYNSTRIDSGIDEGFGINTHVLYINGKLAN